MTVTTAAALARATPATRDRWLDLVRVVSIGAVVLGHWLMAAVSWSREGIVTDNLLAVVPVLRPATWLLQVMPLFFFVGGAANARSWTSTTARGEGYAEFVRRRLDRLVRPVWPLLAVWLPVAALLSLVGLESRGLHDGLLIVVQPLWFLALYVVAVALTPVTTALHRRAAIGSLAALVAVIALGDVARLAWGVDVVKYANYVLVWVFAHQLGYLYRDGRLERLTSRATAAVAGCAFGLLAVLTTAGPYPVSMVGLPGQTSNMSPPTSAIVVLTVALVALALTLRPVAVRWLRRPRVWLAVVAGNTVIMTVFLWHLSALVAVTALLAWLEVPWPPIASAGWWALRVPWLLLLSLVLVGLVVVMRRFEQPRTAALPPGRRTVKPTWSVVAAVAAGYVVIGLSGLALAGLRDLGTGRHVALLHLGVGAELSVVHLALGAALAAAVAHRRPARTLVAVAAAFGLLALAAALPQGGVRLDAATAVTHALTAAVLVIAATRAD